MTESFQHAPVMLAETVELIRPAPGMTVLDGTLGGGGHARAMLEEGARVIGLDKDPEALAAARTALADFGERFVAVHADFADAREALDRLGVTTVEGALVDLGVSSWQLDRAERGFSFSRPGPLDMRMDPTRGPTLIEKLHEVDEHELADVIFQYGEERLSRRIARGIVWARDEGRLTDTAALAEVVARAVPKKGHHRLHPATRTFQALRIWVNEELVSLGRWLADLERLVSAGGRAATIAFHSIEDRMVKVRFRELAAGEAWRLVVKKPLVASDAEIDSNPRSRSAKLRAVERIAA